MDQVPIKLHLGIWKGLHLLVEKYGTPPPPAKMVVPIDIAH